MTARIDLPDINVWLALSAREHPHHVTADHYWRERAAEQMAFCRVTTLGFLRLTTNATVMDGQPLGSAEAWAAYDAWLRRPEVVFANEPHGCEPLIAGWAESGLITPRLWTDAYLASFAVAGGLRLVTFDRDFIRFDGLDLLWLATDPEDHRLDVEQDDSVATS